MIMFVSGRGAVGIRRGVGRDQRRAHEEGLGESPAGEAAGGGRSEEARQGEERQGGGLDAQALLPVAEQERRVGVLALGGVGAAGSHCRPFMTVERVPDM